MRLFKIFLSIVKTKSDNWIFTHYSSRTLLLSMKFTKNSSLLMSLQELLIK